MGSTTIYLNMESDAAKNESEVRQVLFPVEADIIEALHQTGVGLMGQAATQWTQGVKTTLSQLAASKGLLQFPNDLEGLWERGGEWLFDVVWVKARHDKEGKFNWRTCDGLALACESEWLTGEYDILTDFLKLTFAVADLRLFVYEHTVTDGIHPVDRCKEVCPLSRGFRYLTIGFPGREEKCRVDAWTA